MFDRLVRFSARMSPLAVAVSNGAEHILYRDFDRIIDQAAAALDRAGVGGPELVAVSTPDAYRHLVLILACARRGVPTVSLIPQTARPMAAFTGAVKLLSDDPAHAPDLLVDAAWLADAIATPAHMLETPKRDPEALGRVQLSSGSTGEPKAVGMSWALMDRRIEHTWTRNFGYERLLSLIGPESGALPLFLWCWARGGCVLFGAPDPQFLARSLTVLQPTGMLAAPAQLAALLDALPEDATPLPGLQIAIGGAHAAPRLRDRAALRLGTVNVTYASTEAGVCTNGFAASLGNGSQVGWITPWSEIEVVDEHDNGLPHGASGRVRVRGSDVVTGYLGVESDHRFKDGWFYPGDIGSTTPNGMLHIEGREDEVMNFGGQKFLPGALEGPVLEVAGVGAVAAFALEDDDGIAQPWLAIVRNGEIEQAHLGKALAIPELPPVRIAYIDALPVTPLGKVQRERLKDAARQLAGR
ncbi:acyl-CoA synthetase (AMP-forming)/AMP-acid ligase II [Sphingomonas leidyi]|uniref:Acyl-CoA synthetase (AMP-forming)/AMP-acid ligase II n=1 Tax=Sphingomonas leidyi TaxID=68569 RepID=A0A7X5ZW91_9SPHN|nr:class I adenylate-forming enzyme family protein [Sphingomonas leidyi]NIJ65967.1 acyl-CoA synthetase (AMP-forming)/AMP-acid ligase II [Sphingomonas leidyi]